MEIREIVRIKKGTGGLEPPMNLGILLDREKSGKDHIGVLFTLRGELRIKWKSLKEGSGRTYQGDKKDQEEMRRFLKKAIEDERSGLVLKMEPDKIVEKISPYDMWRSVLEAMKSGKTFEKDVTLKDPSLHNFSLTPFEIGSIHFSPHVIDPKQEGAITKVLARCDDNSVPYFNRKEGEKRPLYIPFREETLKNIKDHIVRIDKLRSAFLETYEEEDEKGRIFRRYKPIHDDPNNAVLDDEQSNELDLLCSWARSFLETGSWPTGRDDPFGLGGTGVRYIDRFSLDKAITDLSHHMIGSRRKHEVSDLVGMLLKLGKIGQREASELVVKFNLGSGKRRFHENFQDHVLRAASSLPDEVTGEDFKGRTDLRYLETYTIDPPDAKDFDDAISLEGSGDGWTLWIHIADVSHYVRNGSLIDDEARYRGTSVYLPTGVIPMLPRELSESLCSLTDSADRLAVTTRIDLSSDLEVISSEHMNSVIRVNRNLSYDQVNEWIEEGKEPFTSLNRVAEGLSRARERLSLETPERRVRFEDDRISIKIKRPTKATKMIEQMMVITNEVAAEKLTEKGLAVPYRIHPLPDSESIEGFNGICEALDLDASIEATDIGASYSTSEKPGKNEDSMMEALLSGGKLSIGNFPMTSGNDKEAVEEEDVNVEVPIDDIRKMVSAFNMTLDSINDVQPEYLRDLMRVWMLRTMPRAFYSGSNIGHFGLGSGCYCHFTSPIRRYPDILVHRGLKSIIDPDQGIESPSIDEVEDLMDHVNEMSDEAEEWEREMIDVALCTGLFMDRGAREMTYGSVVSSLTPSTVFISFNDGMMEGRIPLKVLSRYRLHIDESGSSVILSLEGNREFSDEEGPLGDMVSRGDVEMVLLHLGERTTCRIHSISIAEGRIDLSLGAPL